MSRDTQRQVAEALLTIKAVGFKPTAPITFKSGLVSPVYVDNRTLPFNPKQWQVVMTGLTDLIKTAGLSFDVIAGIETAGIPHSAVLGWELQKPSVFIRKAAKDHGTKRRVEGGSVEGKRVLLIEDHVTTGGSSLSGVDALRKEGAIVEDCLAITSYTFAESDGAFAQAGVKLHTLTSFEVILEAALERNLFTPEEQEVIQDWLQDPHGWAGRHGF